MLKLLKKLLFKIVMILCVLVFFVMPYFSGPKISKDVVVEIPKGASTAKIAKVLSDNDVIDNEMMFRVYSKWKKLEGSYKYGKMEFNTTMKLEEIAEVLKKGGLAENVRRFTIPEGYTVEEIAAKLEKEGIVSEESFLTAAKLNYDYDFLKEVPNRKYKVEGYLYPNTYEIYDNASSEEIVKKMLDEFNKKYKKEYKEKAKELGYTLDEVIKIASIIEKEVRNESERPKVAGVIYNRLNKNIKLQMCSTVQYLLENKRARLLTKDTEINSPYNTYMYEGLPKGPIANPGIESIEAALNPETHEYYFFVVKDSKQGVHHFSKTLKEHNWAKRKYYNS
ncbi:MAG: endolytic transglycosylase MltG [Clostridia bacterium]|nr:endolytic transglycosylase MltG [Clostridia bacterium]